MTGSSLLVKGGFSGLPKTQNPSGRECHSPTRQARVSTGENTRAQRIACQLALSEPTWSAIFTYRQNFGRYTRPLNMFRYVNMFFSLDRSKKNYMADTRELRETLGAASNGTALRVIGSSR